MHGAREIASGSSASVADKIDSHQICEGLRSAAEADHMQAVVLRIDTPGWCHCPSHHPTNIGWPLSAYCS